MTWIQKVFGKRDSKVRFLLLNFFKGMIWLSLLVGAYMLFKELVYKDNPDFWIEKFYSNPYQIYSLYIFSEFCFGLIPPEIFMVWAFHKGDVLHYFMNVAFFTVISVLAGFTAFILGKYLQRRVCFRFFQRKYFSKYLPLVRRYGLFLIVVAAVTPLPYSATSLVVGASGYRTDLYLIAAVSRILRFALYGYVIFQTHI